MNRPRYKAWVKAINQGEGQPKYSLKWAASKRSYFKIFEDRIECGDWVFPNNEIQECKVFFSAQMFIPVTVIRIKFNHQFYQFGFNPWASPLSYLNLEYTIEHVKLKHSRSSIILRLSIAIAIVLYLALR